MRRHVSRESIKIQNILIALVLHDEVRDVIYLWHETKSAKINEILLCKHLFTKTFCNVNRVLIPRAPSYDTEL
jgi:hypothetical protein